MKRILSFSILVLWSLTIFSQSKKKTESHETPEGSWTITKEYDEDGNLISSDSTYTYSYSSGDLSQKEIDSIRRQLNINLKKNFDIDLSSFEDSFFDKDFQQSLLEDFDEEDFDFDAFMQDEEIRELRDSFLNSDLHKDLIELQKKIMPELDSLREEFMEKVKHYTEEEK